MHAMACIIEVNRKRKKKQVYFKAWLMDQSNVMVRCYARFIIEIIESLMLIREKKKTFEEHVSKSFILNEKDYSSNYNIISLHFLLFFK